jgi:hypothetical protein
LHQTRSLVTRAIGESGARFGDGLGQPFKAHGILRQVDAQGVNVARSVYLCVVITRDLVSNGRVEWGTGESASLSELGGFNLTVADKRPAWLEAVEQCANMMVMEPYPGFEGTYFSMPCRNVVPKPVQTPHPPLWVACSNRDTIRLAARLGIGALTFACALAVTAMLPKERNFRSISGSWAVWKTHLGNPRLLATCLMGASMLFTMVGSFTYANFLLAGPRFGLTPGQAGGVFTVYLLGLVTTTVATRLTLKIGRRTTLFLAGGLSAIGVALTLLPSLAGVIAGLALAIPTLIAGVAPTGGQRMVA